MVKQDLKEPEEQPKEPEVQVTAGESTKNEPQPAKKKKVIQKKFAKFAKGK